MTRSATGQCMCGVVQLKTHAMPDTFNACYCEMCRRWTGSRFTSVQVPMDDLEISGREHIAIRQTSDWAERAYCSQCGSPIWYRPLEGDGHIGLSLGLFDDANGLSLNYEFYVDHKTAAMDQIQGRIQMTEAECIAAFAPTEQGDSQ